MEEDLTTDLFLDKIMAKKKVDPLLNRISAVDAAARMWYSKRVLRLLKQNTPILKKTSPLWKKRPLPCKKKGKTFQMFMYTPISPIIAEYSDYMGITELLRPKPHVFSRENWYALGVDMGQEW